MRERFPSYMYNRGMLLIAILATGFFIIIIKLFMVQVLNVSAVSKEAPVLYKNVEKSKLTNLRIFNPLRGNIYSRSGDLLATTVYKYRVVVDASAVAEKDRQALTDLVLRRFDIDKTKFLESMAQKQRYIVVGRRIDEEVVEDIVSGQRKISGLKCELDDPIRLYPQNNFASHIVGYINYAGQTSGIEKEFDTLLTGISAESTHEVAFDGADVYLTIDENIQYFVEEALQWGYSKYQPQSISAVVIDPKNGEILALANYPSFNPNRFNQISNPEVLQNTAVSYQFEPGSSFKVVAMAAALEEQKIKETDVFNCNNGEITYHTVHFRDTSRNNDLTVRGILERSSNVGMVKIADLIGKNTMFNYIRRFGFLEKKNLELSGERVSELRSVDKWGKSDVGSVAIGYGIATNLVRLTAAYAALANNGELTQLHIVKRIVSADGKQVDVMPLTIRRVVSAETAKKMSDMLTHVVSDGTAKKAYIEGIKIAAKTGTSIVYDRSSKYTNRDRVIGTFVGYFPADNPRYVVGIMMNQPQISDYAGETIAPIFKTITASIMRYNGM